MLLSFEPQTACPGRTPLTPGRRRTDHGLANDAGAFHAIDVGIAPPAGWRGVHGARLPAETVIRLRIAGPAGAPVVGVLGGVSADRRVACEPAARDREGWWSDLVRVGGGVDLSRVRVASIDHIRGDGRAPLDLCPADEADLFAHALTAAGAPRLAAFIGASYGGMIGLSFARRFPERVGRLAVIGAAHRPSPLAQGWRAVQRAIIEFAVEKGDPEEGVAIARALAMTTYRCADEFAERFACTKGPDGGVAEYLRARGRDYRSRMTAAEYLTLSASIDRHFETPEAIAAPTLVIGFDTDQIAPPADLDDLASRLAGPYERVSLTSVYGHDAFLKESAALAPILSRFLSEI